MNTVLVQPKILIAMLELAGKNDIRFYLNSVFLEIRPAFINYVATNGANKLGVYHDDAYKDINPDAVTADLIIPHHAIETIKKWKTKEFTIVLQFDGRDCTFKSSAGATLGVKVEEGRYPAFRRVIPHGPASGQGAQFQPILLHAFERFAKVVLDVDFPYVHVEHDGPTNGARVSLTLPNFIGVVMPMRAPKDFAPRTGGFLAKPAEVTSIEDDIAELV